MAVASMPTASPSATAQWLERFKVPAIIVVVGAILGIAVGTNVPTWLDTHIQPWIFDVFKWITRSRNTHWLFTGVLNPIADALTACVDGVHWVLRNLRWTGVLALTALIGWQTAGRSAAISATAAMAGVGIVGYWDLTMITLSIMVTSIAIALGIGLLLGIWTSRSDRAERVLSGLLDTAQVMPVFAYLGVLTLAFGISYPPVIVATIIYAVPPAVRMTNLGLRSVPTVIDEVGRSFGATERQHLLKIQLPVARRTILMGLNQVIMMAFGIVVIGSMLGTGDVGGEVLRGLQKNDVGLAFAAGLAIVFAAIALDRMTTGEQAERRSALGDKLAAVPARTQWLVGLGAVVVLALVTKLAGSSSFPTWLDIDIRPTVNDVVDWVERNLRTGLPVIGGTQSISDALVTNVLEPLRKFLVWLPWLVVIAAIAAIGYVSKGWKLAVAVGLCLVAIASMGTVTGGEDGRTQMWDHAMNTLSQVIVAVVISVVIAVPLGVWAGRSDLVNRILRPFLDVAQVLPQFVYLVPVLFLFSAGRSAGVLASVIYAVPPGIRLTSLGLREVSFAPREAAISFGATPRQELVKVQIPLALRSVLLGINQTILMVLATVIIAALIGGGGLGYVSLGGTIKQQQNIGPGLAAGLSIVLLAIVLDRITQAWGTPQSSTKQRGEI